MDQVTTVSGKVVAVIISAVLLCGAAGAGAYYYFVQHTPNEDGVVATDSALTGTVVYRERVPLPAGSSLVVQLLDVTEEGVEPTVVAEQTIITRGENVPIAFSVPYNQSQIDQERRYAIDASILGEGDLFFATPTLTPVLTQNNPTGSLDLLLTQNGVEAVVQADGSLAVPRLPGTVWQWVRTDNDTFASGTPTVAPPGKPFVLTFREGGTFNSTTDCNRVAGSYVIDGEVLSLGSIAMTEMACPDARDGVYAAALGRVTSYVINGSELRLNLLQDSGVMIFTSADAATDIAPTEPVVTPDEPVTSSPEPQDPVEDQVMCTMDVMTCPDGTYVGRVAPSCAFAPCPGV